MSEMVVVFFRHNFCLQLLQFSAVLPKQALFLFLRFLQLVLNVSLQLPQLCHIKCRRFPNILTNLAVTAFTLYDIEGEGGVPLI